MSYTTIQPFFALESAYYFKKVVGVHPFSHFYQFKRDDQEKDVIAVPHGSMDIIFVCDERKLSGFVFGLGMDTKKLPLKKKKTYFGVRLLPGVVPVSLMPIAESCAQGPKPIEMHIDRFCGLASSMSFPEKVDYFLAAYPKHDFSAGGLFANLLGLILQSGGDISIKRLEQLTGYGRRHLHKVFSKKTGVCPKLFANVIKFQRAIQALNAGKYSSLSEIAFDMGYYDHSRFSQAFKQHMAITPREYLEIIRSREYHKLIQVF